MIFDAVSHQGDHIGIMKTGVGNTRPLVLFASEDTRLSVHIVVTERLSKERLVLVFVVALERTVAGHGELAIVKILSTQRLRP